MPRHVWIEVRMQVRRQSGRRHVLLHLVHSRMFSGLDGVAQLGLVQFRRLHGQVIHSWAVANGLVGQVVPVMDLFGTALFPQSLHAPAHTYTRGCTRARRTQSYTYSPCGPRIAVRHDVITRPETVYNAQRRVRMPPPKRAHALLGPRVSRVPCGLQTVS